MDFKSMYKETQKVLDTMENSISVATALLTDKGNLYIARCDTYDHCLTCQGYTTLGGIEATRENRIVRMVTAFKDHRSVDAPRGVDAPCAWLRQFIRELNPDNLNAEVFGIGMGIVIKPLKAYFPSLKIKSNNAK